jgi:hypothetical protein
MSPMSASTTTNQTRSCISPIPHKRKRVDNVKVKTQQISHRKKNIIQEDGGL